MIPKLKTRCYIGLGSNLQDPQQQVLSALEALSRLPRSRLIGQSRLYGSKAIGPGEQGDYVNAAATLDTELEAQQLLSLLQNIEAEFGRQRREHWGPRTLDLDLLLYGELNCDSETLTLPHPRMWQRSFVLFPLGELVPDLLRQRGLDAYTDSANIDPSELWLLNTETIKEA